MFNELRHDISIATTLYRPKYATRSFEEKLHELWKEYVDTLAPGSGIPASVYEFAEFELIKEFNDLTDQKLMTLNITQKYVMMYPSFNLEF